MKTLHQRKRERSSMPVRLVSYSEIRCPRFRQIEPVGGGCCPLSAYSASGGCRVCMYVNFWHKYSLGSVIEIHYSTKMAKQLV